MGKFVVYVLALIFHQSFAIDCGISEDLQNEIVGFKDVVQQIISETINGSYSGIVYSDLSNYVDLYGHRQAGTENLEIAIDEAISRIQQAGLDVSTHEVQVPSWTRGAESAEIVQIGNRSTNHKINLLGLGTSAGTPEEGITAPIVLVEDFDQLEKVKDQVPGKIVVYNAKFVSYGETGIYRNIGPETARQYGAIACLVRSITPFSINSPHTGATQFSNKSLAIPAAAISLEDADRLARLYEREKNIIIHLKSENRNNPDVQSRNVIADIPGSTIPNEYVVLSGHIDSWDVGQGALDDAGGAFMSWHSLALLKKLNLSGKRTMRAILWTAEEPGIVGAQAYRIDREDEVRNWTAAFESDSGVFHSQGIIFAGNDEATCIMQNVVALFQDINATLIKRTDIAGSDIGAMSDLGTPLGESFSVPNNYFWYHHSNGDFVTTIASEDLDQNVALHAATAYILANLSVKLPRDVNLAPKPLL